MKNPIDIQLNNDAGLCVLALNDPDRRNALSTAMFDALENALAQLRATDALRFLLLSANGPSFCAGFDLPAAVNDPPLLGRFILRLSQLNRALRRLPAIVVAQVQGPAIAGGCAILSACDFVFAAPEATLGYPVHGIGLSPAVTIPTLTQAILPGPARELVMSGRVINAAEARTLGLVTHLASSGESLPDECLAFCRHLAAKPPHALRVTKQWLNELDGSLDDARFNAPADHSAQECESHETLRLLRAFWESRRAPAR